MNIFRSEKIKKLILLIGDIACFYGALLLMFQLRFGFNLNNQSVFDAHFKIFSWVFLFWLLVFYMGHFYEIGIVGRKWKFLKLLTELYVINLVLAIVFFYIFPSITPKTNLLLVAVFSFVFLIFWRFIFNSILGRTSAARVLILGKGKEVEVEARPNDQLEFVVEVTNTSPVMVGDVKVVENLPTKLTFMSGDENASYNSLTGEILWELGALIPGEKKELRLLASVSSDAFIPSEFALTARAEAFNGVSSISWILMK